MSTYSTGGLVGTAFLDQSEQSQQSFTVSALIVPAYRSNRSKVSMSSNNLENNQKKSSTLLWDSKNALSAPNTVARGKKKFPPKVCQCSFVLLSVLALNPRSGALLLRPGAVRSNVTGPFLQHANPKRLYFNLDLLFRNQHHRERSQWREKERERKSRGVKVNKREVFQIWAADRSCHLQFLGIRWTSKCCWTFKSWTYKTEWRLEMCGPELMEVESGLE